MTLTQDSLLDAIAAFPEGANLEQIAARLPEALNRRTLQRRINALIEVQRLLRVGKGRATRYHLPTPAPLAIPAFLRQEAAPYIASDAEIPLSAAAHAIAAQIRLPLTQRQPVGYNRAFLDAYRPNESAYLPVETRTRLRAQGQVPGGDAPAGTYARQLAHRLLIDLSWNSSRLEGNTYSLLETERLLSAGEAANGKAAFEAQMILNHKEAIAFLIESAGEIGFNRYTLLNLHALLADNLLDDPLAGGRLRTIPVGIGQTTFLPLAGPQLIDECFDQVLDTAEAIADPFEQAFFAMVHLPYLQPFEDVNKRVSRLAANIPLIRHNLCPLSFVDVPQALYISAMLGVYELNRVELLRDVFVWAYQRSCARYSAVRQSLGEPDPFRLRHRQAIAETIAGIVRAGMNKAAAITHIRQRAETLPDAAERARFVEVIETQLLALHEGNIARFRLRPSEFSTWRERWR